MKERDDSFEMCMRGVARAFTICCAVVASLPITGRAFPFFSHASPQAAPRASITLVPQGAVEVRSGTGDWQPVDKPTALTAGQEVRTKENSTAVIDFSDGSKVALSPSALFAVEKADKQEASFNLSVGKLKAYFAGVFSSRLNIHTPTAVCSVRGTEFELQAAPGKTDMNVQEGHLEVRDNQGNKAVVTSEESLHVGDKGMEEPRTVSLKDEHAQAAARPMTVRMEMVHDQARSMVEELRNRELKANEAQLGKDAVDAFGNRVRIEEYALRPAPNQFELLFLSIRQNRFDYGHMLETFNSRLPDDNSQVPAVIARTFFSKTPPSNWLTNFEFFASNTIDSDKETVALGAPVPINFNGYVPGIGTLYYPASIDFTQTLSGPGVPGGTRDQFRLHEDFNITSPGLFTVTQSIVNNLNAAVGTPNSLLEQYQLNPSNTLIVDPVLKLTDAQSGGCNLSGETCFDHSPVNVPNAFATQDPITKVYSCVDSRCQPQTQFNGFNPSPNINPFPSGPTKADFQTQTIYPDGSTVSNREILVNNDGSIVDFANSKSSTFLAEGSYNLELVINSNLFQGRNIDVLIAPEILNLEHQDALQANAIVP